MLYNAAGRVVKAPYTPRTHSLTALTPLQLQFGCGKRFKVLHFVPIFFLFSVALKCLLTLEIYATFSNTCSSKFLLL